MISLRVVITAVVAAGVLIAAGVLVLGRGGEAEPARERLVRAATTPGPTVLVDARGTVLAEFTGECGSSRYAYVCERVRAELKANAPELLTGKPGLTIRTAIDPRAQEAAQQAIDRHVGRADEYLALEAMVAPGSGEIRALAASHDDLRGYKGFQQGSTAMVYTLAAALEGGLRTGDGFPFAASYRAPTYAAFKNCKGQNVGDPTHSVLNFEHGGGGFTTLESGTLARENTFFVQLTERVGLCESVRMAQRLGLERADGLRLQEFETFALGVNEVDPVAVATTYATLAARGLHCAPRVVTEVSDRSGYRRSFPPRCEQALEAPVADAVTGVLERALAKGPLEGLGRDAAGMDGTMGSNASAGYAGYTPALAAAVALGHPDGYRRPLTGVTIGGKRYAEVEGTTIPGPIWKDSMKAALDGTEATSFTPPDTTRFGGCSRACAD
ncbi:Multimodular transpeptidase-transglycosylase [[Actinomadura] parvosata subsp. kistnae]|uniref:Penicillin-binding protein transpeptidase domain-containing protein n=1 Tax=[Actinomadura] parvosata subsp. kistnae TaxID=1909395 RepID=A0A1V0A550_9ACTN|nr:hypothetical protein [Nonomuraea sp. ATCC 55076]AQZ65346.1 hypothetical protein BKM31_31325 [Nonomuraea sp. ATCC 55076]SPL96669.1 Multimodular transpeptidase-transglycosylase [Actinomadura parvosata subsp. kistnae]